MICVDQNGQAVEISVADQMWLDDAYFKEKQLRLGTDAPRAALAYRVSTKGQVDHDDIPMQKIDCRKFAQKQGWRVVKEVAEKGVSGSKVSASKRDAIQQLKEEAANGEFDILLVYIPVRIQRCWRALSTAPTAERRCLALCTQTAISWRTAASAKKYNLSITAFSAVSGTKAAETVTGKHCTLPREWMPSS